MTTISVNFEFTAKTTVTFGVGRDEKDGTYRYTNVNVDKAAQSTLQEMATATMDMLKHVDEGPRQYEASEKYASIDYVYLGHSDPLAVPFRELFDLSEPLSDSHALANPSAIHSYFARFEHKGKVLVGLRYAQQAKTGLKRRFLSIIDDSMETIDRPVFRLDRDFDFLIDEKFVHVLHPSAIGKFIELNERSPEAIAEAVATISKELTVLDMTPLHEYAKGHARGARILLGLARRTDLGSVHRGKLKAAAEAQHVPLQVKNGVLKLEAAGDALTLLEILDNRRFLADLTSGPPSRFRASSRVKVE